MTLNKAITGWKEKKIGKVVTFLGSGISRPFKTEDIGVPVLRSNNVKDGSINTDELKYWFNEDPRGADISKVKPQPGDILINFVNGSRKELGKAAMYEGIPERCIVSTNFFIVRFDQNLLLPIFVNLFFQSSLYKKWLYRITGFTGQGSFNQKELKKLQIPVPPLNTQNIISKIISTWDKAIGQTEHLIKAKEKQKKALIQQLLTGKRRFKEFIKSEKYSKSKFFEYPDDWLYCNVGSVATEVSERNNTGKDIPVLSCTKYDGLVDSLEYFGKRVFSNDTSNYKVVHRGQFAYATNHIEEGSIGLLEFHKKGLVSPMYTVFKTDDRVYVPFLYKVFKTELYRHIFAVNTNASVNRRGSLRYCP